MMTFFALARESNRSRTSAPKGNVSERLRETALMSLSEDAERPETRSATDRACSRLIVYWWRT